MDASTHLGGLVEAGARPRKDSTCTTPNAHRSAAAVAAVFMVACECARQGLTNNADVTAGERERKKFDKLAVDYWRDEPSLGARVLCLMGTQL